MTILSTYRSFFVSLLIPHKKPIEQKKIFPIIINYKATNMVVYWTILHSNKVLKNTIRKKYSKLFRTLHIYTYDSITSIEFRRPISRMIRRVYCFESSVCLLKSSNITFQTDLLNHD